MMKRNGDAPAIGVAVMAMTPFLSLQAETICLKRGD
jgi:hypothetical protein